MSDTDSLIIRRRLSIGAFLLVFSIARSEYLQYPLTTRLSQHLGYLSFGLYVLHVPVRDALYYPYIREWQWRTFPDNPSYLVAVPGCVLNTLVVCWGADYFARGDGLIVKFGRWVEHKLFLPA
jgi:peptidoglycan/LPS O-acetylase OafA/YrhL